MPMYNYYCPVCGNFDIVTTIAKRNEKTECLKCGKLCDRDIENELQTCGAFDETCKEHVRWSSSMGVNPNRIAEAERKYPGSRYSPDGRLEIIGRKDKLKKLKQRGLVELE